MIQLKKDGSRCISTHSMSLPKDRDGYGLAHLDLHFANFIEEEGEPLP